MGLFSFLHKNKQEESASDDSEFYSRAEEESKSVRGRGKRKQGNQSAAPVDPVLPEKKRARRRLVGALALVLAVVIGLPMILDSEPKPLADDIAIQIPSKDKPAVPPLSKVSASASLDQKEEVTEASPPAVSSEVALATKNEKAKDDQKSANMAKPAGTGKLPVNAPPTKVGGKSGGKPEQVAKTEHKAIPAAEKPDDAARAKAILEGKADIKALSNKKTGKFLVQVAALASEEKINELQTKLKSEGIQSYTQKVATASGDRTRVRVGPFTSKEEADQMRTKLNKLGLNGTLIPLAN